MSDPNDEPITTLPPPSFILFRWEEFVCGCGAAFCNLIILYPLYKLIFRQMLTGVGTKGAISEIKSEGFSYLYRGMCPPLIQKTCSFSLMFGVYDGSRRGLVHYCHMQVIHAKIMAGLIAGMCEGMFVPFERIQTLLVDARHYSKFKNTYSCVRYVLYNHGFFELYRGVVPVMVRNGPANAIFFLLREEIYRKFPKKDSCEPKVAAIDTRVPIITLDWREFACGCGSAFVNLGVTYPVYKLIFRQMLHGVGFTSAFVQLRHEGLAFLYRGIFPPLAQKTLSMALMFGVYDGTRRSLVEVFHMNNYAAKVLAGLSAGTVEAFLLPFERIQTLLADSKFHNHFSNTYTAFRYVWARHGFLELYRGIIPVLCRNGPSNAGFFLLREEANLRIPENTSQASRALQEFLAGAVIGAGISALFYPINVIKVTMQSDMGHPRDSMYEVARRVYSERGRRITLFYRGCASNTFRSFLSWGIMNTAYETIRGLIKPPKKRNK